MTLISKENGANLLLGMRVEDVVSVEVREVQQALLLVVRMRRFFPLFPSTICSPRIFCCHVIALYLLAITGEVLHISRTYLSDVLSKRSINTHH